MGLKRTNEFRQDAVRIALTSGLTRKKVETANRKTVWAIAKHQRKAQRDPENPKIWPSFARRHHGT